MKSQALPMRTVAVIILILIAIAGLLVFFYSSFSKTSSSLEEQSIVSHCNEICNKIQASNPKDCDDAGTLANSFGWNKEYKGKNCYDVTGCTVYATDGTECKSKAGTNEWEQVT
jgi:hypothetical protein